MEGGTVIVGRTQCSPRPQAALPPTMVVQPQMGGV